MDKILEVNVLNDAVSCIILMFTIGIKVLCMVDECFHEALVP